MYYTFWTFFTFIYYTVFSITFNFSVYNGMFKNSPSLCYLWNISEKLLTTMFTPARPKTCFCTLFFLRIDSNCPLLVNKVQLRFYRTVHSCCKPFILIQYFNQLDKFKVSSLRPIQVLRTDFIFNSSSSIQLLPAKFNSSVYSTEEFPQCTAFYSNHTEVLPQ